MERGRKAAALLSDPTFQWVVDDQTNYHLAALVAAPPGPSGADAITYHHLLQHALSELVATLQGHAQAGAAMERALGDDASDDEEDNQ